MDRKMYMEMIVFLRKFWTFKPISKKAIVTKMLLYGIILRTYYLHTNVENFVISSFDGKNLFVFFIESYVRMNPQNYDDIRK